MKRKSVRLATYITPLRYDIELKPDLENFTFSGRETIALQISKKTRFITLHSKEIDIDTAVAKPIINFSSDKAVNARGGRKNDDRRSTTMFAKISYDKKNETATFTFPKNIPKGKTELSLVFRGILNDKMRGFYRSKYSVGGKEYHMATTQFEATDARRAFPCFDEPAHKAVFHVSLVVQKSKTAISNTLPMSVAEHEAGYDIVKFLPTPKMSTYLLAFIVGDFEHLESKTKSGILVRVFTTPGKKHQAGFALDCAVRTLEFYEKYFDIKYPLPVLDMIAIPDFASGAMENWGAVTYRESALLVDEGNSSVSNKQWVALVVAHELAHQWFGNLVTMEWWTHLWLNEGFASYIEYLAVDKLFPKWDIWTQFSTHDLGVALRLDSLLSTHPIEVEVHHPDEIGEIFDEVSYSKGASVIRMLAGYLGEKDFRDGLRYYLKKHSYKNTETVHLWQAFEKVSGKPVSRMMRNWTGKPGYPVVNARMEKGKLKTSQKRFFASPLSAKRSKDNTKWDIPITFKQNKVNFGETGFYRTAYSKELLEGLCDPILNKKLSARDRLGVIRDLFALSEAGVIPTTDALEFLSAYHKEDNYTALLEIAMGLSRLEQLTAGRGMQEQLDSISLSIFSTLAARLGWNKKEGEPHADALLRSLSISRAGRAGNVKLIFEAREKFESIKKGKHVNPDIRGAVYSVIATWGGIKEYRELITLYKNETLHEEKNRIGNALGDFNDRAILKLACEFAMSKHVRIQDTVGILSGVGANPLGRDIWWNFMKKNWKTLVSRYGEGGLTLGRAVKAIGGSAEPKHFHELKKFFATHPAPGASRAISQVLERIEGNIEWLKRDGKIIEKFLENLN